MNSVATNKTQQYNTRTKDYIYKWRQKNFAPFIACIIKDSLIFNIANTLNIETKHPGI